MAKRLRDVSSVITSLPPEIICIVYEYAGDLLALILYISTHKNALYEMKSVLDQTLKKYVNCLDNHQFRFPLEKIITQYLNDGLFFPIHDIVWLLSILLLTETENRRICVNLCFPVLWRMNERSLCINDIYYYDSEDHTVCLLDESIVGKNIMCLVNVRDGAIPYYPRIVDLYKNVYLCRITDSRQRGRLIRLHHNKSVYFKRLLLFGKK